MELLVALGMILVAAAVIAAAAVIVAKVILWITKSARGNKQETTQSRSARFG